MTGLELIAQERKRQIEVEGFTRDDVFYKTNELEQAALAYENNSYVQWPWSDKWWKPTPDNPVRQLIKAGALFQAEADRLNAKLIQWPQQETLNDYDRVISSVKRVADKIDRAEQELKPKEL
jgi:hypothetical protein